MVELSRQSLLKKRHFDIDQQLQKEAKHLYPDSLILTELKRKKLQVKDELKFTVANQQPLSINGHQLECQLGP